MGETGVAERLEPFRTELTGYCYRMLGSGADAEDAAQETLVRAWRAFDRYDRGRGSLRTWLYRIATNICLDLLRGARRRAVAMDLQRAAAPGSEVGAPAPEQAFVQPVPDRAVFATGDDPAEAAVRRESIQLAFVAALQHLPARQRAVLILRDVLAWRADEVAVLLETSVASVTSALQRARARLRAVRPDPSESIRPADPAQRELLARYCRAFEAHDITALVALLHEDATMAMPPFRWWLRGREQIREAMLDPAASCAGARLIPTAANGSAAFWQTRPGPDGRHSPFGLVLLDVRRRPDASSSSWWPEAGLEGHGPGASHGLGGWQVTGITTYLDIDPLLPLFEAYDAGPAELVGG